MTWAGKRKLTYATVVITTVLLIVGFFTYRALKKEPTCFDGKKNGNETNIDCGGVCLQYCPNELPEPTVRWFRSFPVGAGVYHSVAYIEHSNQNVSARSVPYTFKLYNSQNALIAERSGTATIGPLGRTALVETLIQTGSSDVALTRFSFTDPIVWEKIDPTLTQIAIKTDSTLLETLETSTRLTVRLENTSRVTFPSLEVVALLHDKNQNTIAVSKTIVPQLTERSFETVYFTWPFRIEKKDIERIEIIPRINPFTAVYERAF